MKNQKMAARESDLLPNEVRTFAVENATSALYEIKQFPPWVIAKLITASYHPPLVRMSEEEFAENFTEYLGDSDDVRAVIEGRGNSPMIVTRH